MLRLIQYLLVVLIVLIIQQSRNNVEAFNLENNECNHYSDYSSWYMNSNCRYNPNILSNTVSMTKRNGYPIETHSIITKHGYILNLFRILPKDRVQLRKQPVFLYHGLLASSAIWVYRDNQSLAFVLADEGYDVWLADARGTSYSNKHTSLTVNDEHYWDFGLDNIAYDLSKQLNYVADAGRNSGNKKIIIIGHSMGAIVSFMYASDHTDEANRLLKGIIALGPAIYISNSFQPLLILTKLAPTIRNLLKFFNRSGLFYHENEIHSLLMNVCRAVPYSCKEYLNFVFGPLTDQFIPNYLLHFLSYVPTGVSVRTLEHLLQIGTSGSFSKFSYGFAGNMKVYGQSKPPTYNLTKITLPIYMFYGNNDAIATEKEVRKTYNELGSKVKFFTQIPLDGKLPGFNHIDFLYAKDIDELLYKPMLQAIDNITNIT